MSDLFDDRYSSWTRNAAGKPVIWNKPPYRKPDGRLSFLLPGEDRTLLHDTALNIKRILEYYLLVARDSQILRSENKKARRDPER